MFNKYITRGAGYHWQQISKHPLKRSAFSVARYKNVISLVENNVDIKGKSVLDVGCGDGVLSYLMSQKGLEASGVDSSREAIDFAKQKTKNAIDFRVGDVYSLPWGDDSFDIVVSSDVIEHLDDVGKYISEIKRVLKKGGVCVLSTPIRITEKPLDSEHVVEWFEGEYHDLIESLFIENTFYKSHPVCFMEIMTVPIFNKPWGKLFINILSMIGLNVFETFKSNFRYMALQYSVSKNNK